MKNSILTLIITMGAAFAGNATPQEVSIYVSTTGNDLSSGSKETPVATLNHALELLSQSYDHNTATNFHIILGGGTYYLPSTAVISEQIAGNPESHLYIEAAEGEVPVLSGGKAVTEWRMAGDVAGLPDIAKGNLIEADVDPTNHPYRQMWVNGNRVWKASTYDDLMLDRIISKDADGQGLVVPRIGYDFQHPEKVETTIIQDWALNIMRVKSIKTEGDRSYLKFEDTETEIEFKRPWPILRADGNSYSNHYFKLSNAIELLNRPREWHNDEVNGKLYYWPAHGEEISTLKAEVPVLETIVNISGTLDRPVQNVTFKGITFSHSTWMRPAEMGHVALQCGLPLFDMYSKDTEYANNVAWVGRPAAGVSVSNANDITFEDCRFEHLGSTGLDFVSGVKRATVRGSVFNDVGGNAILGGYFGDENFEAHTPWNPEDKREVCEYITIDNNYIAHPASEDWGCLAVAVGYASNVTISHNEIFDTPYSAINMGWGWVKNENVMHDNHIIGNYIRSFSNQMRDSGAIYTLSSQPNSSIEDNCMVEVGDPQVNPPMWDMRHSQFDLYTDEGTDYYTVRNNWCERGEISKNQNGSHNVWGANGPSVAQEIKDKAGLEEKYKHLPSTVIHPAKTPADSIADTYERPDVIDYLSASDGFKLGTSLPVDLNNDGLPDIVFSGGESFQVQHGGVRINKGNYHFAAVQPLKRLFMGNFAAGDLNGDNNVDLVQAGWDFWSSYNAVLMNDGEGNLTANVQSVADASPACGIADLNCDGLSDYFFFGNGSISVFMLQNADGTFRRGSRMFLGQPGGFSDPNMICADFNNDGAPDIWLLSNSNQGVFTEIFWNNGKGIFNKGASGVTQKGTRGGMACGDLNGDGWLDIVIGGTIAGEAWNTTAAEGGKTVSVYFNDRNGHFIKQQEFSEYMFDNTTRPLEIIDWNNDGYSDIILTGWNMTQGNVSRTSVFLNDGTGHFTLSDVSLPGVSEGSVATADFNNSGRHDILINGNCNGGYQGFSTDRRIAVLCKNKTANVNTRPYAPGNLSTEFKDGLLTLSWDAGNDKETPAASLSYNFYLRDLETGKFITSPNADISTGRRKINALGNAWLNRSITLRNLPAGRYAWSVQTLDASNEGSEFAPEQQIVIESSAVEEIGDDMKSDTIISVKGTEVCVENPVKEKIEVYAIDGRHFASLRMESGRSVITLPKGLYLIDGRKVII